MLELKFVSTLGNVFPHGFDEQYVIDHITALKNEPVSFQLAYRCEENEYSVRFYTKIESDLDISFYNVGYVSVPHVSNKLIKNDYKPGLFPDILYPRKINPNASVAVSPYLTNHFESGEQQNLIAFDDSWQALWFTINEKQKVLKAGLHTVKLTFYDRATGKELAKTEINVKICDAKLPPQKLMCTNWFHLDCLSDYYNEPIFSDRFFEIIKNYLSVATKNGMNMVLLPAFTPALDTPIGSERKTAQLVNITLTDGKYSFDFSLMERYIKVCKAAGIKYFEHCHLFSQWGAKATPKIMATVDGVYKQIFGWKTEAGGKKYKAFLKAYIPSVKKFLSEQGLLKKTLFHISDEPESSMEPTYRKALSAVGDMLDDCMVGDAISDYSLYERGLVRTPIVTTDHIKNFYGKCNNIWAYYTGAVAGNGLSNRLIINKPEENRMLGIQLYMHNIKGFLHWAYNYYYDLLSSGMYDPKVNACGYNGLAGSAYLVYPANNGTALQSTRQKVFFDAINDIRALELLEKVKGKEFCRSFVESYFGEVTFRTVSPKPMQIAIFREELNKIVSEI